MKKIYNKLFLLLFLLPFTLLAQSTLDGTVVDQKTKQPIPGVNVLVQGATGGTQTDFDGKFKLSNVKKGDKVVFSYIGYKNQTISFNNQNALFISLVEDSNELKEVVVQTGYGSVKKKDATGSVALVTSKDFNRGAIISTDQLLTGKVAGVRITSNGGQPDSAPNIRIRGGSSLNASNNPLIIIDGVPISDQAPAGVNNPLTLINPNDVESFSILKDASATAIYGIRASNGVILITTKKGTVGKPEFTFSSTTSISKISRKLDVMNSYQFVDFIKQYYPKQTDLLGIDDPNVVDNLTTLIDESVDNPLTPQIEGRLIYNTDWQNEIFRTAISTDNFFSARANIGKKIPFRASFGYNKTEGVVKTSDYERLSYSFKITPKLLKDNLKIDLNAKGSYTDKNNIDEDGAIGSVVSMDPTKPVYDPFGNNKFGGYYQATALNGNYNFKTGSSNPLAILEQRSRPERILRFLGNIEFDYSLPFIKGLRANVNLGLDASQARIREFYSDNSVNTYTFNQTNPNAQTNYLFNPGLNYSEDQTSTNTTADTYLAYSKGLQGALKKFDVQLGYSYQNFKVDGIKENFRNDPVSGIRVPNINDNNLNNRYYSPLNLQAFFGRTNFDILNKYLFTATLRADATSLFVKENRWSVFPAVGAAWKLKSESFLKNVEAINELKLRLGWGKTGQSTISDNYFPSQLLFEPGNQNSQYLSGVIIYSPKDYNPNLTWEKTTTINAGLDFEILKKGLLSGSFDYYTRKTTDLISKVQFEAGSTASGVFFKNIGSMDSNGFEANLTVKPLQNENLNLSFSGNVGYNKSNIVELKGFTSQSDSDSGIGQTGNPLAYNTVGYQPYEAYVFEQIYDSNGQPIVGAFKDLNGDNVINNDDKYYKPLRPNWTYGFNTSINYKNWDFVVNFRGQVGGQIYNKKRVDNGNISGALSQDGNSFNNVLNFYSGAANPSFLNFNNNLPYSDYLLEDASFLRCDNLSLSYKLAKFVENANLRLSGSVNNLFIVTKYSGQDPENISGIDRNFYPRPKIYSVTLTLNF